nr:hypothetical protein Iba_chr13fCG2940 [Ipomoea batatas]
MRLSRQAFKNLIMASLAALAWEMQAAQVLEFLGIQVLEWMEAQDVEFLGIQALAKFRQYCRDFREGKFRQGYFQKVSGLGLNHVDHCRRNSDEEKQEK